MILSPRKTKLLSALPKLCWMPIEGASSYTVIVRSYNQSWQASVLSATEIAYPGTAPELKPGVDYKLIVQAGNRSSEAEPGNGLGFSILGANERRTVEEHRHKIESLGLPPGPTLFLTAYLYHAYGLESEAILKLEAAAQEMNEPAVTGLLADCYLSVRLVRKAEDAYLKSLQLAGADEDSQAETHYKLGDTIYRQLLGNPTAAAAHLNAALDLARKVGDADTANRARQALAMLMPNVKSQANGIMQAVAKR
jgi:tetratricopeptide (TPR) repeat protein